MSPDPQPPFLPGADLLWVLGGGLLLVLVLLLRQVRTRARRLERELIAAKAELAEVQGRLRKAAEARNTFVAAMSHELRTPMNAILLYCELLIQETEEQGLDAFVEDLRRVQHAGNYLLTLIQSLLDFSRLGTGQVGLASSYVDVATLFGDVVDTLRPLAERKGNRLEAAALEPGLDLTTDAMRLKQILVNLGSSACRLTERGTIVLRAGRAEGGVRFEVEDNGEGMTQEQLDQIFHPFDPAAEGPGWGLGPTSLGLTLSEFFAERMGGWIRGTSTPGKGSCFRLWLPLAPPTPKERGRQEAGREVSP